MKKIAGGGFGNLYKAYWKSHRMMIALKTLKYKTTREFVREIAEGLLCLHAEGILHRDLHPQNVLVHQGKMLIAYFGLSKEETSNSVSGSLNAIFGMILWKISSEKEPFAGIENLQVVLKISREDQKKRVEGMPESYFRLYTECWDEEPNKRSNIEEVVEI
ncbi:kinase-like domain-containing protein [Glomus cerebriforme]|uniref:Kinase-like domain-containing protein n=1 Tax=Glomus cerebriforme TaxID=658196 RepID=A0A397T0R7_9GLOM|nr:kinase-like domain-containing protein [Glomus cerebriforme]